MTETSTQPAAAGAESSRQEQRGVTVIPAQVVAQIAAQAAYESANVGSNAGGLLGIGARRNFHSRPEAKSRYLRSGCSPAPGYRPDLPHSIGFNPATAA